MNEPPDPLKLKLDYSWAWFSYHAGQRFAAFNFFVVAIGALAVAYASAETHRSDVLGAGIASFSCFLALALLAIDVRNTQLVNYGRGELAKLESHSLDMSMAQRSKKDRNPLINHSLWLRAILGVSAISSILAMIWALNGFRAL